MEILDYVVDYDLVFNEKLKITIRDLLKKMNLDNKVFVVVVNDKIVTLDSYCNKTDKITILPKIAGGN